MEAATKIAIEQQRIWPGMMEGLLSLSRAQAEEVVSGLEARGVVDGNGELTPNFLILHRDRLREIAQRQRDREAQGREDAEIIGRVTKLLMDIRDPQSGDPIEFRFVKEDGTVSVEIRGTEDVREEAQRRLSAP